MGTERELVGRVLLGDTQAARALYDAHAGHVHRLIYRLAADRALAEDCMQETFVRAFGRLHEFRGDSGLATWLRAVATSVTLNALRRERRFRTRETELEAAADVAAPRGAEPDVRARLERAVEALPARARAVFLLFEVEGYSHEEIGRLLGISAGASKVQLTRTRARLREELAAFHREWVR